MKSIECIHFIWKKNRVFSKNIFNSPTITDILALYNNLLIIINNELEIFLSICGKWTKNVQNYENDIKSRKNRKLIT